tara:strand:+ start:507 stop:1160 length:654 start_codon:yes stop_codon:yes gene_type:complete
MTHHYKIFNFKAIEDFDKHIELSIPNYSSLTKIFTGIGCEYAQPESAVIDIGCSTGRFLSQMPKAENCEYIGIDKNKLKTIHSGFDFKLGDIEDILPEPNNVSVIISMFTLQFLGSGKRKRILQLIKERINRGAILLIAEKVYLDNTIIQTLIHRMHVQEKRTNFQDQEILDKDTQLAVSMFCKTERELNEELKQLGNVSKIWQSYNFMGYAVGGRK